MWLFSTRLIISLIFTITVIECISITAENVKTKNVEAVTTKKPKEEKNEEVVIKKIETPKRERRVELLDDEPFDTR